MDKKIYIDDGSEEGELNSDGAAMDETEEDSNPKTVVELDSVQFDSTDSRYVTYTRVVDASKGGAPGNQALHTLLILCHPASTSPNKRAFDNAILRCPQAETVIRSIEPISAQVF